MEWIIENSFAQAQAQTVIQLKEALRESETRYRELAEAMPQLIWTYVPGFGTDYANQRWFSYMGIPLNARYPVDWKTGLHPEDVEKVKVAWDEASENLRVYEVECRYRNQETGEYRWFLSRAMPATDQKGQIRKWYGSCTDIHEQKRAQEALAEALQTRDMFLSIASHELNTPITTMRLQLQIALRNHRVGKLTTDQMEKVMVTLSRQSDRLAELVDRLLDVTRINSSHLELNLETVDLGAMIREAAGTGSTTLDLAQDLTGNWDRLRIDQVLTNLLSNASKYGRGRPVRIRAFTEGDLAVLEVIDQGMGISPEKIPLIFNQFERGTPSQDIRGLGLGLYITREIVRAHGGSIEVESELGEGSTFRVRLPRFISARDSARPPPREDRPCDRNRRQ